MDKKYSRLITKRFLIEFKRVQSHLVITEQVLAGLIGTESGNISHMKKGSRYVTLDMLYILVNKYGADPMFLLGTKFDNRSDNFKKTLVKTKISNSKT